MTVEDDADQKFEINSILADLKILKSKIEEHIRAGAQSDALTPFSILLPSPPLALPSFILRIYRNGSF